MAMFKAAECLPLPEPFGFDKARLACLLAKTTTFHSWSAFNWCAISSALVCQPITSRYIDRIINKNLIYIRQSFKFFLSWFGPTRSGIMVSFKSRGYKYLDFIDIANNETLFAKRYEE